MISVKFEKCQEFFESVLPKPTGLHTNTQLLLEFTVESNKEEFLGEYIKDLIARDVFVLLLTQEGNSTFYTHELSDYHLMPIELSVLDTAISNYEFKKFGQIPMNENKILFAINNVVNELEGKKFLLIIFDSLTDLILWHDFNIAYKFMRKGVSTLRRNPRVSSIFQINRNSHSAPELSEMETLFDGIFLSEGENECSLKGPIKYRYLIH